IRLHQTVGAVPGRARRSGQLRDEPEDAPRDQGPGPTGDLRKGAFPSQSQIPPVGFHVALTRPFQAFFRSLAGVTAIDWLFMIGLLGIGVALILGVAIRPAAFSGALMLLMMWAAVWVPAKTAGGQPSGSTNPIVDEHIVGIFGLIVLAGLATWGAGYLGRKWGSVPIVAAHSWLR